MFLKVMMPNCFQFKVVPTFKNLFLYNIKVYFQIGEQMVAFGGGNFLN